MIKIVSFCSLFLLFLGYTAIVYTKGTDCGVETTVAEQSLITKGKLLFQEYNCTACHQIYGLGGYLGPDLTTAIHDPDRGEPYVKALLKYGGVRMPNFHFSDAEINAVVQFLKYTARTAEKMQND